MQKLSVPGGHCPMLGLLLLDIYFLDIVITLSSEYGIFHYSLAPAVVCSKSNLHTYTYWNDNFEVKQGFYWILDVLNGKCYRQQMFAATIFWVGTIYISIRISI